MGVQKKLNDRKREKNMQKTAFAKKKHIDNIKKKRVEYVPHPTIPKTWIEVEIK